MPSNRNVPSWEEWRTLSEEVKEYTQLGILDSIDKRLLTIEESADSRSRACDIRFKKLENRKAFDKVSSFFGGVFGGTLAMLGKSLFK